MHLISCLFDVTAIIMMICLLVMMKKQYGGADPEIKYFRNLPVSVILMGIADSLVALVIMSDEGLTAGTVHETFLAEAGYAITAMIISIADIYLTGVFLAFWVYLLCWHLFHDDAYIKRRFWYGSWPLLISGIAMMAGVILVVLTDKAVTVFTVDYIIFFLIRAYYFVVTLFLLREYRSQNGALRFFNVWAFFLPVIVGWLLHEFTGLNLRALGSALGVLLLYISTDGRRRYVDEETGLYNTSYIDYLKNLSGRDRFEPKSALVYDTERIEDIKTFAVTLKKYLPEHCEPVRCSDKKVVIFTGVKTRGPLSMVLDDVTGASGVKGDYVFIGGEESSVEFVERVCHGNI